MREIINPKVMKWRKRLQAIGHLCCQKRKQKKFDEKDPEYQQLTRERDHLIKAFKEEVEKAQRYGRVTRKISE